MLNFNLIDAIIFLDIFIMDLVIFQNTYLQLQKKIKTNKKFLEYFKLIVVILIFLISIGIYWYFTNINSTQWYFLRQINKEYQNVKIQYELSKLEETKRYTQVLNDINFTN